MTLIVGLALLLVLVAVVVADVKLFLEWLLEDE